MITLCGFGVSNYYNKIVLVLMEKNIPYTEKLVYPWEQAKLAHASPLGKIPYIETDAGPISESAVIVEYLECVHPAHPLFPRDPFQLAKCRELIQHLELNCEWVVRRLYKQAFFGGVVSEETRDEVAERLSHNLAGLEKFFNFRPYIFGSEFSVVDCVAFVHFMMIKEATVNVYGCNFLERFSPQLDPYMGMLAQRPAFAAMLTARGAALQRFLSLGVKYDG